MSRHYRPSPSAFKHPSISDVIDRNAEIRAWMERRDRRNFSRRVCRLWIAVALAFATLMIVFQAGGWLAPAAGILAAGVGFIWLAIHPKVEGNAPEPLQIVPFTEAENDACMIREGASPLAASCSCPGCGKWETHSMEPAKGEGVYRRCQTCSRRWMQV